MLLLAPELVPEFERMGNESENGVTALLVSWRNGDDQALDTLIPIVYSELRQMARRQLHAHNGHSLQPTELTHDLFLKIARYRRIDWQDRVHFFSIAARMMRRLLIEHARRKHAAKRLGATVVLQNFHATSPAIDVDLLALNEALSRLERMDERLSRVVELRYFGGLTIEEVAEVLGASRATVKRDWSIARLWLRRELERREAS